MTNIIFFGSSEYSVKILQKLIALPQFSLVAIATKPDKPVGRDQTITGNPVSVFAKEFDIPTIFIESFDSETKQKLVDTHVDLALCVAFGPPFFDSELIDMFPHKIVNIHPSPLPKYRGATPGPWQIINGETKSAVTFFQIDLLPDHGPIIATLPLDISSTDTADSFYQKAFTLAAENLDSVLTNYIENPCLTPQAHDQKTYYPKLTKENGLIDWKRSDLEIDRFIRGLYPWPVATTQVKNKNGDISKMKVLPAKYDHGLILEKVQIEGKKPTSWAEISPYYDIIK